MKGFWLCLNPFFVLKNVLRKTSHNKYAEL